MAAPRSTLPPEFYQNFGISQHDFQQAFEDVGNGMFRLRPGWSLAFTHAVLTTGDRPTTVATVQGHQLHAGSAGELWRRCTRNSVTQETCCVYNCPSQKCTPANPQNAGATAHVYATFQTPQHDISFMILIPTCSADNNARQCASSETNFAPQGEQANILYTVPGARMIFIRVTDATATKKGNAGKATGKGGGYRGPYPPGAPPGGAPPGGAPPGGAPPGAQIVG